MLVLNLALHLISIIITLL